MPRIISFAETTPALLAGAKTVTRRDWKSSFAAKWHKGSEAIAYSKSPRNHGKPVARIRLTEDPVLESSASADRVDWEREGFAHMTDHGMTLFGGQTPMQVWQDWHLNPRDFWVVRFEIIELLP